MTDIQRQVANAIAEAVFHRRPYCMFNHPLFPKDRFVFWEKSAMELV